MQSQSCVCTGRALQRSPFGNLAEVINQSIDRAKSDVAVVAIVVVDEIHAESIKSRIVCRDAG